MGPLVVLAYSGGLDTSAIVPWLREQYGAGGDQGQEPPLVCHAFHAYRLYLPSHGTHGWAEPTFPP